MRACLRLCLLARLRGALDALPSLSAFPLASGPARLPIPLDAPPSLLARSSLVSPVGAGALWLAGGGPRFTLSATRPVAVLRLGRRPRYVCKHGDPCPEPTSPSARCPGGPDRHGRPGHVRELFRRDSAPQHQEAEEACPDPQPAPASRRRQPASQPGSLPRSGRDPDRVDRPGAAGRLDGGGRGRRVRGPVGRPRRARPRAASPPGRPRPAHPRAGHRARGRSVAADGQRGRARHLRRRSPPRSGRWPSWSRCWSRCWPGGSCGIRTAIRRPGGPRSAGPPCCSACAACSRSPRARRARPTARPVIRKAGGYRRVRDRRPAGPRPDPVGVGAAARACWPSSACCSSPAPRCTGSPNASPACARSSGTPCPSTTTRTAWRSTRTTRRAPGSAATAWPDRQERPAAPGPGGRRARQAVRHAAARPGQEARRSGPRRSPAPVRTARPG